MSRASVTLAPKGLRPYMRLGVSRRRQHVTAATLTHRSSAHSRGFSRRCRRAVARPSHVARDSCTTGRRCQHHLRTKPRRRASLHRHSNHEHEREHRLRRRIHHHHRRTLPSPAPRAHPCPAVHPQSSPATGSHTSGPRPAITIATVLPSQSCAFTVWGTPSSLGASGPQAASLEGTTGGQSTRVP